MVAKISTGGNMFGALAYNQNKVDSRRSKGAFSNRMLLGGTGISALASVLRSFEMQIARPANPPRSRYFIFSINPHRRRADRPAAFRHCPNVVYAESWAMATSFICVQAYRHRPPPYPHRGLSGWTREGRPLNEQVSSIGAASKSPVNWKGNTGCIPAERKERAERPN